MCNLISRSLLFYPFATEKKSIEYYKYVSILDLVIRHAKRIFSVLCGNVLTSLACLSLSYFFLHFLLNGIIFGKFQGVQNVCLEFFFKTSLKYFFILSRFWRDIIINGRRSLCKIPAILVRF
jgi:hypothetical protein